VQHQYTFNQDPVGCGLLGCLGGLFLGLVGGAMMLLAIALITASVASIPVLNRAAPAQPDLSLTIEESFLNRYAEHPPTSAVAIDILPNNQVQLIANTPLQSFGIETPVQITGLFQIQLTPQNLFVELVDVQILGIQLPPEISNFFSQDLTLINQGLEGLVAEISRVLGMPVIISNLHTTNSQIQLEIREAP
jgi:hypothetical protein